MGGLSPVPVQMWAGWAQSRQRRLWQVLVSLPSAYFNEYFSRKTFMSRLEMRHSTETVDHLLQV